MAGPVVVAIAVALLAYLAFFADVPLPYPASHLTIERGTHHDFPLSAHNRSGPYAANTLLRDGSARLFEGQVQGAETPIVAPDGSLFIVDARNELRKAVPSGGSWALQPEPLLHLGTGRVLAGKFDPSGALWLCDAVRGLLKVEGLMAGGEGGRPRLVLAASRVSPRSAVTPGSAITYADDLDIGADGTVYFSDATGISPVLARDGRSWDTLWSVYESVALGRPTGRLLRYRPTTGEVDVLAQGLWFANGVALAADESYLMVADSITMGLYRHWLKGPKAGNTEPVLLHVPGHPDGVWRSSDSDFWVSMYGPAVKGHQLFHHYLVRLLLAWMPKGVVPRPQPWGGVLRVGSGGEVVQLLEDPQGEVVAGVTAALEGPGGKLLMGNLLYNYVGVFDLSRLGQQARG